MQRLIEFVFTPIAAGEPAGGAALGQVVGATAGAALASAGLLFLISRHRAGRTGVLSRAAGFCQRLSGGLPSWAALPSALVAISLVTALLGMYWDISLHAGQGRDEGPLANPAHYLILFGLFGVFAAGALAITLPVGERPGPAPVRITRDWYAPVGGVLIAACGAFALIGFPLDDLWHRLFGQDVTLWGPTHIMLFGGAGLTLVGQAVLLVEGMRGQGGEKQSGRAGRAAAPGASSAGAAAADRPPAGTGKPPRRRRLSPRTVTYLRRTAVIGGLLIGVSTLQGEFDFGIPQFRLVFQPTLIALAAGIALVAGRIWIGRGGALAAAAFYLVIRGLVTLLVGPVFGEATPALPLYAIEALCVEAAALAIGARRRPLALGVAAGVLIGTVGFASEWGWSHLVMRLPWTGDLLPEALVSALVAGVAGGAIGALLATGLRGELPRPAVARGAFLASMVAIAVLIGNGLATETPTGVRASVSLEETSPASEREALATVTIEPAGAADEAAWLQLTAWQGGTVRVDRLESIGDGVYRSTEPVPLHGNWKTILRLHDGRTMLGAPVFLPEDPAIPAPGVPAQAQMTREFGPELQILQRERRDDVPAWLFTAATLAVLALTLAFIAALAWGVGRVARAERHRQGATRAESRPRPSPRTPAPLGSGPRPGTA